MTYEELKIKLDLYNPEDVLKSAGKQWYKKWFVVCDDGDCHLFKNDGTEDDVRKVNKISSHMFFADIKKIVIPDSVTILGRSAFWGCIKLTNVTIPDSVTCIEPWAFTGCRLLTNIMIPDSVTHIGEGAFSDCWGLTSVTIPDRVTTIERYAFCNCSSLTSITIPDSVTHIREGAFIHCASLESVTIPDTVKRIESFAFENCRNLKSLVFKGKNMRKVKAMAKYKYSWGVYDESVIKYVYV